MSTTYTVSQLAAAVGSSPDTLRYYEKVGLLPAPERTPSGYRRYDDDARDRLAFIRGAPLEFRLGVGQVISGWDTGVQGMKVGGRRRLVIPPHLAYGDRGAGGAIQPGETLIFVCDLVSVD